MNGSNKGSSDKKKMGTKQSKTAAELDLDKIEQLADEQDYAKKKKHLEPDLIGAKLGHGFEKLY